ncbi:MAG: aldehyde dehydrogenase family protein [Roseibium sp.]
MKPFLINGEWVTTSHGIANINPSDISDVIGIYAQAGRSDAEAAVQAASDASAAWAQSGLQQRHDILQAVGQEILARKDELGELLAREEGKILREAIGKNLCGFIQA